MKNENLRIWINGQEISHRGDLFYYFTEETNFRFESQIGYFEWNLMDFEAFMGDSELYDFDEKILEQIKIKSCVRVAYSRNDYVADDRFWRINGVICTNDELITQIQQRGIQKGFYRYIICAEIVLDMYREMVNNIKNFSSDEIARISFLYHLAFKMGKCKDVELKLGRF